MFYTLKNVSVRLNARSRQRMLKELPENLHILFLPRFR